VFDSNSIFCLQFCCANVRTTTSNHHGYLKISGIAIPARPPCYKPISEPQKPNLQKLKSLWKMPTDSYEAFTNVGWWITRAEAPARPRRRRSWAEDSHGGQKMGNMLGFRRVWALGGTFESPPDLGGALHLTPASDQAGPTQHGSRQERQPTDCESRRKISCL
jgi:hypothetical protein